ncbi:response regulator [Xanthobacter sp. KR7-65]|uniref:hybrid sensor histidine kinase/response regulator n=1 Tax=Xanthobacter sp. KR7-65 TaxID=3156612 RepID=UPI0032B5A5A3
MTRSAKDELRARLLAIFREEAADHMRAMAREMEVLDQAPDDTAALAALGSLFRTVHTLKGAARSLSIRPVETLCHKMEDLCGDIVQGRSSFDVEAHGQLRALTDELQATIARSLARPGAPVDRPAVPTDAESRPGATTAPSAPGDGATPPHGAVPAVSDPLPSATSLPPPVAVAPAARSEPGVGTGFVRIETSRIQRLGLMAEDLLAPRLAGQARAEEARRLVADIADLRRAAGAGSGLGGAEALKAMETAARRLAAALTDDSRTLKVTADGLAAELRSARMMPAGEMLAVFPAMVADLAREMGKSADWHTLGEDLMIDRQVAELVKDPLLHMVRNALDHGIETPAARVKAGKPPAGAITLSIAPAENGRVAIEVSDDGAGIDLAAVREAAVRSRLLSTEEAKAASDMEVLDLVFQTNLSTRGVISVVSGRGLGLAIVRERAERLGGRVTLRSTPGAGTTVGLEVPAALANFRGIAVRTGGDDFVWPRDAVERTLALPAETLRTALARGHLPVDGRILPFGRLADALGRNTAGSGPPPVISGCLIVRHGERRGVVAVDEVTGDCEVVVKDLRPPLLRVRHVLAAGILANGRLALILRAADVLDALARRPARGEASGDAAAPAPARRPGKQRLLIVDDSLTTRAMEVGLLEAAGYEVESAADGMEAWAALQRRPFDAVVSDVDMPRMDGFELTQRIRDTPRLRQLPIVLLTALEKREDHDKGLRLGANAYMMKSAFDQSLLIDLVRQVL